MASDDSDSEGGYEDHLTTLEGLKEQDPEFFKYLSENDRNLLNFNISDEELGESEDETADAVKNEKFHKPPNSLQVASDESDFSDGEDQVEKKSGRTVITSGLIAEWKAQLEGKPKVSTVRTVMLAFRAAVEQASDDDPTSGSQYVVKGTTMFNSVVRLCLTNLLPALHRVLGLPPPSQQANDSHQGPDLNPKKSKSWNKVNTALRGYLSDMVKMLSVVVETEIIVVILRHILYWVPFYIQYSKHSRLLLKKLISFWSTSEESIRVLAFLGIIRVLRVLPTNYLDYFLKKMYLSYVSNCKFTSPNTWPLINFMKRSLVELYSLDPSLAYQHSFVYIRQLAIHLRISMTSTKKDANQVVYNWQYVHCLLLWTHLLATVHQSQPLASLIYPLVQVTLGAINLIQTPKYLPLRFHLIRALTVLSSETNTFIPVLSLIVQVFQIVDFNKTHSSLSIRPMDFSCILKLSKSQLQENTFRDGCMQQIYELLMDYLNTVSHLIAFPELVFPASVQMKTFLKTCKVANYNRQIKQALDKMEENSKFISEKRTKVTFGITDQKAVDDWEKETRTDGTPVTKYYTSWRKLRDQEIQRRIANKDQSMDIDLPAGEKMSKAEKKKEKKRNLEKMEDRVEFPELFASDTEDDDGEELTVLKTNKKEKAKPKKVLSGKSNKKFKKKIK